MDHDHIINHLGEERDKYFGAVSPPIIQTSNFAFKDIAAFRKAVSNEMDEHIYTRGNNPTVNILRQKLAALEHTEDALVFASGSAAISCAIMSQAKSGDHVVCVQKPYSWTYTLLNDYLVKYGVTTTFVDGRSMKEIEEAIQENTKVLFLESPNTASFEIQDLEACATLAKTHGIVTMIDNSYASPIFQNPADYGIDLIIHSATKYINGHSDVVMGVVCGSKKLLKPMFHAEYMTLGAVVSPHDASLVIRGMRTLEIRMKQVNETTQQVIEYLSNHEYIDRILYPFHEDFPQRPLAIKQMTGAGGLFSVLLKVDSKEKVHKFIAALNHFLLAVSWGGHESLVLPFVALYGIPNHPEPEVPWNLVRFYIGLESADFLIRDLKQALEAMK